jgi:hypothetical protein
VVEIRFVGSGDGARRGVPGGVADGPQPVRASDGVDVFVREAYTYDKAVEYAAAHDGMVLQAGML